MATKVKRRRVPGVNRSRLIRSRVMLHRSLERALRGDISAILREMVNRAAEAAERGDAQLADDVPLSFEARLREALVRRNVAAVNVYSSRVLKQFKGPQKKDDQFESISRYTVEFIKRRSGATMQGIVKRHKKLIRDALARSESEGLSAQAIAREIRKLIPISLRRAKVIARTETHTAVNYGVDREARESGLDMVREWGVTEDERTRQTHIDADGQTVGMEEPFSVGNSLLMYPGDPDGPPEETINCRCVVLFWPKEP